VVIHSFQFTQTRHPRLPFLYPSFAPLSITVIATALALLTCCCNLTAKIASIFAFRFFLRISACETRRSVPFSYA
jgi:hypothetical protein